MRVLLAFLATVLGLLFGLSAAHALTAVPTSTVAAYLYDGNHHTALATRTTSERGPPPTCRIHGPYDAVDRWSYSASALPGESTLRVAATCDPHEARAGRTGNGYDDGAG